MSRPLWCQALRLAHGKTGSKLTVSWQWQVGFVIGKKKRTVPGWLQARPVEASSFDGLQVEALAATWGQPTDELSNPTGGDSLGIAQQVGPLVSKKPENRHGFGDPNIM